jgi:hypothetical protein
MYFPGIDSPLSPLVSISGWTYSSESVVNLFINVMKKHQARLGAVSVFFSPVCLDGQRLGG